MRFGVCGFVTDLGLPPQRLAAEVEARGFESLWVTEKTHVPTDRRTPWAGGELPPWYLRTLDPFVALAAAAGVTTRLRLGTGVALFGLRDPVIAAKEVASLDHLSTGRVELGVGYGWNAEELATHRVHIDEAGEVLWDRLAAARALWRSDVAEHLGPHARVPPSWSWPKPVRPGGPRVHLGSRASARAFADIAAHADGWIPIEGYGRVVEHLPRLALAVEGAGRDPADVEVTVFSSAGRREDLDRYEAAGVARVCLGLPAWPVEDQLAALDRFAGLVETRAA